MTTVTSISRWTPGISRIRATGGHIEPVYKFSASDHLLGTEWPVVLPGARGVLFRRRREGQAVTDFDIMVQPLPRGEAKSLTRGIYARYSPSGHLVVVTSDGKLLVIPFSLRKLEITGAPSGLYEGLEPTPFGAAVGLSQTGTLVYQTASQSSSRELDWVSRSGVITPVDQSWKADGAIVAFALSPNGGAIAVELQRAAKSDIWVKQLPAGPFSRITFGDTTYIRPSWRHDGNEVYFLADRGDGGGIPTARRADGVGAATRLSQSKKAFGQVLDSPDGSWLILRSAIAEVGNGDIYGLHAGDTTLVPLVNSPAREGTPALSPDGKWLAYSSDESGGFEVYVRPFPNTTAARWQVSTAGGTQPLWSHSGKELFFRNNQGDLVSAEVKPGGNFSVGEQKTLFSLAPFAFGGPIQLYAITPDDKTFLMMRETSAGESGALVVSENWFEELKAKGR